MLLKSEASIVSSASAGPLCFISAADKPFGDVDLNFPSGLG